MRKIIVLSPGRQVYLIEQFKKYFAVAIADNSQYALDTFHGVAKYKMPRYKEETYAECLLSAIKEEKADFLLSLSDLEIPIVSSISNRIEALGCNLLSLPRDLADICLDKQKCSDWLRKNGINTPLTFYTLDAIKASIENGQTSYPIIAKERRGMGSRGLRMISSPRDFESIPEDDLGNYIFQEYIKGLEYGLDIINDIEGNYFATVVKKKINMAGGETEAAIVVINDTLQDIGKKLSAIFNHKGNMDCDVMMSESGKAYVIDVNPRFGGGYIFTLNAGMDVPYLLSQWAEGNKPKPPILIFNHPYRKITTLTPMEYQHGK